MKKILNSPDSYVDQALAGMVLAHPAAYRQAGTKGRVIARRYTKEVGKVGIASGGGFGHLPLFAGYVGTGLLDSCAVGDVFAGPSLDDVEQALRVANLGAGILCVIGNYGGDKMVFGMAAEALEAEGVEIETVVVADDVASAPPENAVTRRGVAGVVLAFKIAGAAAESSRSLRDTAAVTRKALESCRSIGVALSSCTVPKAGKPTFELEDDAIEMGMGIHGEQGVWRGALRSADDLADEMLDRLQADCPLQGGDRVAVLCNSLGATPLDELYILYRHLAGRLASMEVEIAFPLMGHYATSMEMAGASLTVMKLDDELASLLQAPARCPHWKDLQCPE
ncbi:dihydroxyacetone kinase subunit DhaK [Pelagibius litoralis]|uniref:Dihydroxyacetone kinase subunit DhaK n=1 Tax=Pelagibius litoralis TaxID=374515 RepID=A0A967EXS5_9PROT|nr:dihydroxyacetone kinase subunit DhaK [Pelagibius litoralis]NIA69377.1 dihydroxyacetone kinase subunit DhaK [Pelagibius litoralis]